MWRLDKIQQVLHPEDICQECDRLWERDCTRCAISDIMVVLKTQPSVVKEVCGKKVQYEFRKDDR